MPITGFLHGLEHGFAEEVATSRAEARQREDQEFQKQLSLLDMIRQQPDFDKSLYQRVLADTLKIHKGQASVRKPKGGIRGYMGQTETGPYASDLLNDIQEGKFPLFNDPQATEKARQPLSPQTVQDIQAGGPGAVPPPPGSESVAGAGVPTPPVQAPPEAAAGPPGAPAAPAGAPPPGQPPVAVPPPGPPPQPPGTAPMVQAGADVAGLLQVGGPIPPAPKAAGPTQTVPRVAGSSVFRSPEQQAGQESDIKNIGARQDLMNQSKNLYDAMIQSGASPEEAKREVAKKLTGYAGTMTTKQGGVYVMPDGRVVRALLQTNPYGDFSEIDPQTQRPLDPGAKPFIPGQDQVEIDKQGVARVVNRMTRTVSGPLTEPGKTGQAIGKPQIPPPGGPVVITVGPGGEPQVGRAGRSGTDITPMNVVPPAPKKGEAPTPSRPATKYEAAKPVSASAETTLTSVGVVERTAKRALDVIAQLEKQGTNANSPIGQSIDKWFYSHGWLPGELEAELFQNVGANEANALKTVMGGRPNMKLIDILQMHTAQPGDSLALLKEKLHGLLRISEDMRKSTMDAQGQYKARPYDIPGQTGRGASPPASPTGGIAPPPPKFTDGPRK